MSRAPLHGWPLAGWTFAIAGVVTVAACLGAGGGGEGLGAAMRWTARLSGTLFLLAFSASALQQLWPGPRTRYLLANRRYLGVSFAVAHAWHLGAVIAYLRLPGTEVDWAGLVPGGLVVAFIAAMVATSFDHSAAWLGARRWKQLHTVGGWLIWFAFFSTWAGSAAKEPWSALMAGFTLAAVAVRIAAVLARSRSDGRETA